MQNKLPASVHFNSEHFIMHIIKFKICVLFWELGVIC